MKVIVYHSFYGCESGCCGHVVKLEDGREEFCFDHPDTGHIDSSEDESAEDFAKRIVTTIFGEEHVKDLDWLNCIIEEE